MRTPCLRCGAPADVFMTYDYEERRSWLDDLFEPPEPNTGYALCSTHAGRFSPPSGWTLVDRRNPVRPLFADRVVA